MQAVIDISEPELGEIRNRFEEAGKPKDGVTIQIVVNWSPDGIPVFHFPVRLSEPDPRRLWRPETEKRKKRAWTGLITVDPGVSSDWADIQRSIEEGWAAEVCEKERRLLEERK